MISWSAIARGAALRGLEGSKVPFKKCRYHYGTTYDRPFDKSLGDDDTDSTWEHIKTGKTMVRHCMDWHFTRVIDCFFPSQWLKLTYIPPERRALTRHPQGDPIHSLVLSR